MGSGSLEKGEQMPASLDTVTSSRSPSSPHLQSRRGVAIVLLAVVIWSTTPVFIDHLQTVNRLSPLQVSTWRALLVTLLLALYLLVRRPRVLKLQRREIGYYVTYGVVGIGLFNLAFNTSVAVNKASVATALMFCAPVFVALGSWWVFHERLRPLQMLAMVVNLLGFALVGAVSALLAGTDGNVSGLLLGLFSGICFALFVWLASHGKHDLVDVLLYGLFYGLFYGLLGGLFSCLLFGGEACIRHSILRLFLWHTGDAQPGDHPGCRWLGAIGHTLAGTDALRLPALYGELAVSLRPDRQYLSYPRTGLDGAARLLSPGSHPDRPAVARPGPDCAKRHGDAALRAAAQ